MRRELADAKLLLQQGTGKVRFMMRQEGDSEDCGQLLRRGGCSALSTEVGHDPGSDGRNQ